MLQDEARAVIRTAAVRRQAFTSSTSQMTATSLTTSTISLPTPQTTTFLGTIPQNESTAVETLIDDNSTPESYCTVALPSGGILRFNESVALRLNDPLAFSAPCMNNTIFNHDLGNQTVIPDSPFYASIAPQIYTLAATTIISYVLVIILFITPRTFYLGGLGAGGAGLGGGRGLLERRLPFMGSGSGSAGAVGVGRRPLLQKIATITVAVSLTIATSDTFNVAERQYNSNFMNASDLVKEVIGSNEIKITRVVSDAFLWLAQVQTLIRLFPRHKEKVTIKWLGFGLVICDTVFSILENFVSQSNRVRPASFDDAIPALSYLFEMAISLIYASCVVYYSLSKRRFAYWHSNMRNICLVALMSLSAVLVPVVFFIVDVAQPDIATWGEYIRWVGSAAASVVVWEWVERIEALERDEKKDGILGREIFDGDEMIDVTPSEDDRHHGTGSPAAGPDNKLTESGEKSSALKNLTTFNIRPRIPFRHRPKRAAARSEAIRRESVNAANGIVARPPQAATPISRSDTNSAASTVYAVRYHNPLSPSPAIPENEVVLPTQMPDMDPVAEVSEESTLTHSITLDKEDLDPNEPTEDLGKNLPGVRQTWHTVANPFKRKRAEPPAEVAAQISDSNMRRSPADRTLNLKNKFNAFAALQRERFGGRVKSRTPLQVTVIPSQRRDTRGGSISGPAAEAASNTATNPTTSRHKAAGVVGDETPSQSSLPVTVIPAPVRGGRTWSPDDMDQGVNPSRHGSEGSSSSSGHSALRSSSAPTVQRQNTSSVGPHQSTPGRSTNSPGARSLFKAPDFSRNRAATGTSLSGRIGETTSAVGGAASTMNSGSTHWRGKNVRHNTPSPSPPTAGQSTAADFATHPPDASLHDRDKQKQKQAGDERAGSSSTPNASGPGRPPSQGANP